MSDFTTSPEERLRKRDKEMIPLVLVRAMFFLALLSVALVAYARLTDRPLVGVADLPAITDQVTVFYAEDPDQRGRYIFRNAAGETLATSSDPQGGFLAAMGRTIDRRRMLDKADITQPLTIVRRENGRVAILDPASSFKLELMGYGADNVASIAQFLPPPTFTLAEEAN